MRDGVLSKRLFWPLCVRWSSDIGIENRGCNIKTEFTRKWHGQAHKLKRWKCFKIIKELILTIIFLPKLISILPKSSYTTTPLQGVGLLGCKNCILAHRCANIISFYSKLWINVIIYTFAILFFIIYNISTRKIDNMDCMTIYKVWSDDCRISDKVLTSDIVLITCRMSDDRRTSDRLLCAPTDQFL